MKHSNFISKSAIILLVLTAITLISCTTTATEETPVQTATQINSGPLKLVAIDTAKVITMTETGTTPVVVLNRKLNQNSYISDFSFSPDGTKFIYVEQQLSGTVPNLVKTVKLKIVNSDGSADTDLFSAQNALQGSSISSIRYCSDGKIFFVYKMLTPSGNASALSYNTINSDGGGLVAAAYAAGEIQDVSNSRRFYIQNGVYPNLTNRTTIYDNTLDNSYGVYLQENFSTAAQIGNGSFTNDGKYAVIPFKEGSDFKVKIIDMATKAVVTKTIVSGSTATYPAFTLNMASDGIRAVLTIQASNFPKSKTYVFNAISGVVNTPFENNDENVFDVFAY